MNVLHQNYYNKEGKKECWDMMQDTMGKDFTIDFCLGSAYKYAYRAGLKEDNPKTQDIAKIKVYMDKARELSTSMFDEDKILIVEKMIKKEGIDYGREK